MTASNPTVINHSFGGDWTQHKLEMVGKYLKAYATIMRRQPYNYAYIDAFAGTGYITAKDEENFEELFLPELAEQEVSDFIDGSARVALQTKPEFNSYIFIEQDPARALSLEQLKTEYPSLAERIKIRNAEANGYIQKLCKKNWEKHRAVMFLDPYGMQVTWETIEAIARTKAIDLWILFPLGVAVNRLLRRDGCINKGCRQRLNVIFGTEAWYDEFYKIESEPTLYGDEPKTKKHATPEAIGRYYVARLKTIFPGVADNPLTLYNTRNSPLYLLCFASGNPRGSRTAIKIAGAILGAR